ncbi:hypothetical protein cypCar_00024339 [Cyprinus carpio]|nr:hypothetical protein cypCar_00024339 [Cyprinus carpio]
MHTLMMWRALIFLILTFSSGAHSRGEVTFEVRSDSPTLTGAKATFNIDVRFPQNQTVLPDGQVVWARNCTINGKYWQVADGPTSLLTIETDKMPLGSYTMDIVIYHCRGKDKFVPLGYASTQFSITDQIPFTVTLSQVGDINQGDQSFIQNRAVSFDINLHDPSHYLSASDITFNWDFGDNSGTLISRETTVTHTYLTTGSFRPQVVLMAAISTGCQLSPTPAATVVPPVPVTDEATAVENIVLTVSPQLVDVVPTAEEGVAADVTVVANDLAVSATDTEAELDNTGQEVPTVAGDTAVAEADNTAEVMLATLMAGEAEPATEVPAADMAPEGDEVIINLAATVLPEPPAAVVDTASVQTVIETVAPTGDAIIIITPEAVVTDIVASVLPAVEDIEAVNETVAGVNEATEAITGIPDATVSELEAELVAGTEATQAALIIAKRQAPEMPTETNCMIYRYGSFSTTLTVVRGIESVEIVEVNNVVVLATELEQNAVDLTVTCQGRRFKEYHPLSDYNESSSFSSGRSSVPLTLWNLLSWRSTAESRPLLLGRVV